MGVWWNVDTQDLGSCARKGVRVRVPPSPLYFWFEGDFQHLVATVLHNGTLTYSGVAQLARVPDSESGG